MIVLSSGIVGIKLFICSAFQATPSKSGKVELSYSVETVDGQCLTIGQEGVVLNTSDLPDPADAEQIQLCMRWLSQAEATAVPMLNSHWLKQVVEHWAGTRISNGALIIAAHRAGFPIGRDRENNTVNVTIGVSPQSVNEFDCGCGHP